MSMKMGLTYVICQWKGNLLLFSHIVTFFSDTKQQYKRKLMPVQQALEKEQGKWIALLAKAQKRADVSQTLVIKETRKCWQLIQEQVHKVQKI